MKPGILVGNKLTAATTGPAPLPVLSPAPVNHTSRVHRSLQSTSASDVRSKRQRAATPAATPTASTSALREVDLRSATERLLEELQPEESEEETVDEQQLLARLQELRGQIRELDQQVDQLYSAAFAGISIEVQQQPEDHEGSDETLATTSTTCTFEAMSEAEFARLGREEPQVLAALLEAKESQDADGWQQFQAQVRPLKLRRTRLSREAEEVDAALGDAVRAAARRGEKAAWAAVGAAGAAAPSGTPSAIRPVRIVLITGFESFNVDLYKRVAKEVATRAPNVHISVFSDRDLSGSPQQKERVAQALSRADALFASLLFDYDQVEWLRERIARIPVRLVFESALELMGTTQVGSFNMAASPSGEKKGPPPVVKKVLSLFGSQREEDRMVGYLAFLKVGPQLLKWVPGQKAADLKHWLTIYSYWNQGGLSNVTSMFLYLAQTFFGPLAPPTTTTGAAAAAGSRGDGSSPGQPFDLGKQLSQLASMVLSPGVGGGAASTAAAAEAGPVTIAPPVETPALGCLHPGYHQGHRYFNSPAEYMKWYQQHGPLRGTGAPVVGVLLYRKHVITEQPYILQLISLLEQEGVLPVPIFINGVEAHTVVRDLLTSETEQAALATGTAQRGTLKPDAVRVDAVISTIGFPLVGGPAGSMEGGRQADVAKGILRSKNIPYVVAAPLLIQDMASWARDGVAGLQSVVLYSLPELDGAIDTVPLGGLVGDSIYLVPERVRKVAGRLKAWANLRRKPVSERKVAVLLYGFPPGVGATGTAALLNVPRSLQALLGAMKEAGYELGDLDLIKFDGEAVVAALSGQEEGRALARGAAGINALGAGKAEAFGVEAAAVDVTPSKLKEWLTYPPEWGPNEWGPLPYLPEHDVLVKRMEKQWGELRAYRGISTSNAGALVVPGLAAGNLWIGVQPALGVEGDPMRLLFERDLTPHPQYAAFYRWIQQELKADVVLHFGMHGTVEWLPGAPLGNTGLSWSDVLLGELPNVYVYACNNPSESIVAKRRGYGTIVSHNVPPYGRAGLYKQLATLKDLIGEDREARNTAAQQRQQQASGGEAAGAAAASAASMAGAPATATAGATMAEAMAAATQAAATSLRGPIIENMRLAGLMDDMPYLAPPGSSILAARQAAAAAEASSAAAAHQPAGKTRSSGSTSTSGGQKQSQQQQKGGVLPAGAKSISASSRPPNSVDLTAEEAEGLSEEEWGNYMSQVYSYLSTLENRLFSEGLHVLGAAPTRDSLLQYLSAYFDTGLPQEALEAVADLAPGEGADVVLARLDRIARSARLQPSTSSPAPAASKSSGQHAAESDGSGGWWYEDPQGVLGPKIEEAVRIRRLLERNTEELAGVLRGLGGEYIEPEAGGDLLRDGAGVLPTGRNIHALDPYRMPSPAAMERGAAIAEAILAQHQKSAAAQGGEGAQGQWPETVAVNLWGLDAIKTKGESVGIVLALVGARPVKEATGRIARYELLPLEELGGRPRIDVLCNMSGIFRDSFQNVVELLDDLFQRAAAADEPPELNYVRKHAQDIKSQGLGNPAARLFSNPAGDYGSMVNERVGTGAWENGDELGDTWAARNAFSYGRGGERGAARPEVLQALLATTDRVVQEVDSVEYGLTDIQEYYANTGALARAAKVARKGRAVGVSVVEAFGKDVKPRELDEVLRLEYRSKLLNPRWAEAMAAQGSGGAYEISQRMTAMVGWGATTGFQEGWAWDQAAATYVQDREMAERLKKANPKAFSNVLRRMLEAAGRGMWAPNAEVMAELRRQYSEMDDVLEGVTGASSAPKTSEASSSGGKKQKTTGPSTVGTRRTQQAAAGGQ